MIKRLSIVFALLSVFAAVTLADAWDKKTVVTLKEPVMVAGAKVVTLEPGKYVFKLLNSPSDRNIVLIYNEREDHLFAMILALNNYRLTPTDKTNLRFWETPIGNPPALRAWFYPGDNFGQEFVYPKGLAAKIAKETGTPVLAAPIQTEAELETAPITEIAKTGEELPLEPAYVAPPALEPELAEAAPPEFIPPAGEPVPAPLPATGSPYFLVGIAGVLVAASGLMLRRVVAKAS